MATPAWLLSRAHGVVAAAALLLVLNISAIVQCVDSESYHRIPPLYAFEDRQKCFSENPSNIYCVARTIVKPDNSSDIWHLIEKYSAEPTDYQHDLLDRGFCMETCKAIVNRLTEDQLKLYDQKPFPVEHPYIYDSTYIPGMEEYKQNYSRLTTLCLGHQLHQDYNLLSYSEIEHCMTSKDLEKSVSLLHVLFAIVCSTIILFVVCATAQDLRNIRNNAIWMEFSLKRSFRRLTEVPKTRIQHDFAFVETLRVVSAFLISALHIVIAYGMCPMVNPDALEGLFRGPLVRMGSAFFPFFVHTFFAIGGLLMAVNFLDSVESSPRFQWRKLYTAVRNRYLRILPTYLIVWLYQVSWFDRMATGLTTHRLVEVEQTLCRQNSWTNLLLINNLYQPERICMQQTWYLSADFQFFCIGTIIMMILWRFPKATKAVIIGMLSWSVVVPIIVHYIHNFAGMKPFLNFKHLRFSLVHYKPLILDYYLPYAQSSSYFSGIIAGIVYHRVQKDSQYLKKLTIYKHLKLVAPIVVLLMAAPATLFYSAKPPTEPSLWHGIYASTQRNFFGITYAIMLLYGATEGRKRLPAFLKHPVMLAVGRLSFCVYFLQFNAFKLYFKNDLHGGFTFDVPHFIDASVRIFTISYAAGLILCTTVELPMAAVVKRLQGSSSSKKSINESSNETEQTEKVKTC